MRFIFFSILFFCASFFLLNAQSISFQKIYTGNPINSLLSRFEITQVSDSGYLCGNSNVLFKTDSLGQLTWFKQYDGFFRAYAVTNCFDKGCAITGGRQLVKLDSSFSLVWAKEFTNLTSLFYTIKETSNHGFVMGAEVQSFTQQQYNTHIIKTDSVGTVIWSKLYKVFNGVTLNSLVLDDNDNILFVGDSPSLSDPNLYNTVVVKIDSAGNPLWGKRYFTTASQTFSVHITNTSDKGYAICGYRNLHRFLLKIDSVGNKLWQKKYEAEIDGDAKWVEETPDHGLVVTGILTGSDSGFASLTTLLFKTDSTGNLIWARELGGYIGSWASCVKPTHDNGFVVASRVGWVNPTDAVIVFKTDSLGHTPGCLEGVPIITVTNLNDTVVNELVTDSVLNIISIPVIPTDSAGGAEHAWCSPLGTTAQTHLQDVTITPNPATTHITLQYHLTQNATLQIHDITGRRVQQTTLNKKSTTTTIDVRALPNGMYFYGVQGADRTSKAGKFIKQ